MGFLTPKLAPSALLTSKPLNLLTSLEPQRHGSDRNVILSIIIGITHTFVFRITHENGGPNVRFEFVPRKYTRRTRLFEVRSLRPRRAAGKREHFLMSVLCVLLACAIYVSPLWRRD